MRLNVALFYHSLVSDWNHGNAHFLRGIAAELLSRGHGVEIFEPAKSWSRENLLEERGLEAIRDFETTFPDLRSRQYELASEPVDELLDGVDLAIVHEWNDPALVAAVGQYRRSNPRLRILFHDTHHRACTATEELARFDLSSYDGVLAYGASLKRGYERLGWGKQVFVWHEAADTRVFYPRVCEGEQRDLVWIGNWGDEERTEELREFLLGPVRDLGLSAQVHGVRYPEYALRELDKAGIVYGGWVPNYAVPDVFAQFKATVHVPRRPYVEQLPGIPTIRPFEALACGIPLVSAPWRDEESLFRVGTDFLMVENGDQMRQKLRDVLEDDALARTLAEHGLETIRSRHTCAHRVTELLEIVQGLGVSGTAADQARSGAEAMR
jgi:spore maturation protein CgeB